MNKGWHEKGRMEFSKKKTKILKNYDLQRLKVTLKVKPKLGFIEKFKSFFFKFF